MAATAFVPLLLALGVLVCHLVPTADMDHRSLAGTDERAPLRRKAWDALGKWIASRVSRQRGVHVPNLFQIAFRLVATDDTGSKLRRPIFLLSE